VDAPPLYVEPELRLFDVRIYVDTDADLRLIRRIRRVIAERPRSKRRYRTRRPCVPCTSSSSSPRRYADIIIRGWRNSVALDFLMARLSRSWVRRPFRAFVG
jgi:uridine kinase